MAEALTKEEVQNLKAKTLRGLEKKEVRQQTRTEFLREKGRQFQAKLQERRGVNAEDIARKQVIRQNLRQSAPGKFSNNANRFTKNLERTGAKQIQARAAGARRLAGAFGVSPGQSGRPTRAGAGRPTGTYKYGMPIRDFQKLQAKQRALARLQGQQAEQELIKKGYTPQQIQLARGQSAPMAETAQEFDKALEEATISPNTLRILENLKQIQGKAKADDANMQRILRERKMVSQQGELLKAPSLFKATPGQMEGWLERPETNPLRAPNIFAEDRNRNPSIMDTQGRPNILQSVQKLNFFGDPLTQEQQNRPIKLNFWKS